MPYFKVAEQNPNYQSDARCGMDSCGKIILPKVAIFECSICKKCFHPVCKQIVGAHIQTKAALQIWCCSDECTRISTNMDSNSSSSGISPAIDRLNKFEETVDMFLVEMNNLKKVISELKASNEFISKQYDDIKVKSDEIVADNLKLKNELNAITQKSYQDRVSINKFEALVDDNLQRSLNTNLIIAGLPNKDMEAKAIVTNFLKEINSLDSINDICYIGYFDESAKKQSSHDTNSSRQRPEEFKILVKFGTVEAKYVIHQKKKHKFVFANQVGFQLQLDRQLYIRDQLTPFKGYLYRTTQKLKKMLNFNYLYINKSSIFFRKEEKSKIYRISSRNDINQIMHDFNIQQIV